MAQKAIVGEKVGMTQVWTQDRRVVPVTVLRVEPLRIVQIKTKESDGYCALQDKLVAGEIVDVTAVSRGKGFAGGMKRHNFRGQGAAHGNHKHHRAPGSIGQRSFPGRVFRGMRMAGHMGHEQVTILNLEVVQADAERNLLLVKGAVPGPNGGVVIVRDAVKGGK